MDDERCTMKKSPLTPPFDRAQDMLFQRGEPPDGWKELSLFLRISPFEKGGLRGI